jgi:signal transduction histidine kinase
LAASSLGRRVVGAPIQRLIDQARRVGRGDFARSPALLQHDEIGELTDEMNTMATQLEETQRRMREERAARQEVEIQLRHADRLAKAGRLAAGIVHDTGTPLNVIAGRAKMIERATSPEEVSRAVEAIVVQSKRIAEMLRRLLDFSRPAEGDQEPVDLKALAEETRLLLEPMAKKHQVELELHAEGAPAVLARGGELRQVVTNLLVNAIQAMPRGGVVSISARAVASLESSGAARCLLSVRDRGDGIPPEILPRIFEPFFTTKSDRGGTGLGLSVCQAIVRDHGGELSVWSEQGQGAEFTISLPALVEEAEPCRVAS